VFNVATLSEHVRILASEEFEGRESASAAEIKTIDYLSRQFAQLGLQPAGDEGSWTQAVSLRRIEMTQPAALRVRTAAGILVLHHRQEAVFTSFLGEKRIAIGDAPIVFVGYGISAPERDWDDFKGVDLREKVAVFLINDPDFESPTPGRFGGKAMTYYGRWTYKFEEAARRGAAAALIVHEDAPASYGWATVQSSWGGAQFDIDVADSAAAHTPIRGWLRQDIAELLFQRSQLEFKALKQRAMRPDFVPVELTGAKLSVEAQVCVTPAVTHNIIARLPGRGHASESVLYTAHWDHLGVGRPDSSGDRIYHGAIDNATAVAALLELARVFADAPRTARSIDFVAFAAEEKGLLGSQYYVRHPSTSLESIAGVFNMELMGIGGPMRDLSIWGNARSSLQDALDAAAAAQDRSVTPDWQLEAGYLYRSDHFPFARHGVPAITVSSGQDLYEGGVAAGRKAYSDYITHRYHQPADRWSEDLDLRGLALDLEVLYQAGRDIAESAEWPQWSDGAEFKNQRRI
jgi:Zn-dependent M28 family amino/carboxypeptidase